MAPALTSVNRGAGRRRAVGEKAAAVALAGGNSRGSDGGATTRAGTADSRDMAVDCAADRNDGDGTNVGQSRQCERKTRQLQDMGNRVRK